MSSDDELMQDSAEDLSAGEGKLQTYPLQHLFAEQC